MRIPCLLLKLQEFVIRPTSRAGRPPELSDVWPERAAARDRRIFRGVVQSRYCAPQEGQGSYTSVLDVTFQKKWFAFVRAMAYFMV